MVRVLFAFALLLPAAASLYGQGCIIARSNGEAGGPESQGGYLTGGEWDFGISYRHQFSFRHFVGPTEQVYRIQQGTEVMNKINLMNYTVTYQATPRWASPQIFRFCLPAAAPITPPTRPRRRASEIPHLR